MMPPLMMPLMSRDTHAPIVWRCQPVGRWALMLGALLLGGALWHMATGAQAQAQAQTQAEPARLGIYKNWTAWASGNGTSKQCFITSRPQSLLPQGALRGTVFMSVSHRPTDGVRNEVGLRVGYPFSDKSRPYATIGERRFQFFSGASLQNGVKEWAWLQDLAQHDAMVQAMKRGARLSFRGTSQRGTLTTDTYSLLGFTAAMRAIDAACP